MKILNYTPHTIDIVTEGRIISIPSDGVARVTSSLSPVKKINGIDIMKQEYGVVLGLPSQQDNVYIIVSRMIYDAMDKRSDLLVVGESIRDNSGKVIGCKNLSRY